MTGDHRTLTEELEELERTDPEVRAAAESLDRAVEHLLRGVPVTRFRKSTAHRPVEVIR
jgi:hypothetical protein